MAIHTPSDRKVDRVSAAERKTFERPDETREFDFGRVDLVDVAGAQIGRLTLEPGWR